MASSSIWVDADACPKVIKDILIRAAERTGVTVTLVANQPLIVPRVPSLKVLQVAAGFDVADNEIVRRVSAGDLVVTADIPLAALGFFFGDGDVFSGYKYDIHAVRAVRSGL